MNLILTTTCNKNCSFCFASGKKDNNQFDMEKVKRLVLSNPTEGVKLLGGEPTLYKNFSELLTFLKGVRNDVLLISNFLIYKPEVKEAIIDFQKEKELSFLLNASETTEKQFETMFNNIKELTNDETVSLGFTFDDERDFNSYEKWLNRFLDDDEINRKVRQIRVSAPFPANGNKDEFSHFHNYKLGDLFVNFVKYSLAHNKEITTDCGIFPCMFRNRTDENYVKRWASSNIGCHGLALDLFPDGAASLCYPRKDISVETEKHNLDVRTIANHLTGIKDLIKLDDSLLPKECINCEHRARCGGPCLGFCKNKD